MHRRKFLASTLATSALCAIPGKFAEAFPLDAELPQALRDKLMQDPFRPQFHLLPRANWMNDPCAPRFFRGQYHMFFQYNPGGPIWGDMHWAHATSPDLIHWKHQPIALSPSANSYDAAGCFTGSVLPGVETASILYTGVTKCSPDLETIRGEGLREVQCMAISSDADLRTWKKLAKPVLQSPPPGLKVTGFRDPCPWKDGDIWYLGVGSGFTKVGGAVLLYRSSDGRNWEYLHPLAQGTWNGGSMINPVATGEMWECPDFFPLAEKHVLLYSTGGKVNWEVGVFDKHDLRFHAERKGLLDHGSYYAMKTMLDAKGRRILWGWVTETRTPDECKLAGWAGSMALPRLLTLDSDNQLHMETPPEFSTLRKNAHSIESPHSAETLAATLAKMPIQHRAGEIVCTFRPQKSAFALELRASVDTAPIFVIKYDGVPSNPTLSVGDKKLQLASGRDGTSTLHLWMDGSIIELFVDGREAMTSRCFAPSAGNILISWTGAVDALKSLKVYNVTPISSDRLTS